MQVSSSLPIGSTKNQNKIILLFWKFFFGDYKIHNAASSKMRANKLKLYNNHLFNGISKGTLDYFSFALLCSVIGPKFLTNQMQNLNQSQLLH